MPRYPPFPAPPNMCSQQDASSPQARYIRGKGLEAGVFIVLENITLRYTAHISPYLCRLVAPLMAPSLHTSWHCQLVLIDYLHSGKCCVR